MEKIAACLALKHQERQPAPLTLASPPALNAALRPTTARPPRLRSGDWKPFCAERGLAKRPARRPRSLVHTPRGICCLRKSASSRSAAATRRRSSGRETILGPIPTSEAREDAISSQAPSGWHGIAAVVGLVLHPPGWLYVRPAPPGPLASRRMRSPRVVADPDRWRAAVRRLSKTRPFVLSRELDNLNAGAADYIAKAFGGKQGAVVSRPVVSKSTDAPIRNVIGRFGRRGRWWWSGAFTAMGAHALARERQRKRGAGC